jgi:hypothetical protein
MAAHHQGSAAIGFIHTPPGPRGSPTTSTIPLPMSSGSSCKLNLLRGGATTPGRVAEQVPNRPGREPTGSGADQRCWQEPRRHRLDRIRRRMNHIRHFPP